MRNKGRMPLLCDSRRVENIEQHWRCRDAGLLPIAISQSAAAAAAAVVVVHILIVGTDHVIRWTEILSHAEDQSLAEYNVTYCRVYSGIAVIDQCNWWQVGLYALVIVVYTGWSDLLCVVSVDAGGLSS